jgi:hypothetical protein
MLGSVGRWVVQDLAGLDDSAVGSTSTVTLAPCPPGAKGHIGGAVASADTVYGRLSYSWEWEAETPATTTTTTATTATTTATATATASTTTTTAAAAAANTSTTTATTAAPTAATAAHAPHCVFNMTIPVGLVARVLLPQNCSTPIRMTEGGDVMCNGTAEGTVQHTLRNGIITSVKACPFAQLGNVVRLPRHGLHAGRTTWTQGSYIKLK